MTQSFDDRRKEFEKAITPKVWEVVRQTEEATKRRIWESIQRFQINASDAGAVFKREAEFSGKYPLHVVAGLDPAFSTGGDKCVLRLAVLGHHVNGSMVLDFRGEAFVFVLKILANTGKSDVYRVIFENTKSDFTI